MPLVEAQRYLRWSACSRLALMNWRCSQQTRCQDKDLSKWIDVSLTDKSKTAIGQTIGVCQSEWNCHGTR